MPCAPRKPAISTVMNVVAIHHALMQSGIEPQPVDIVVTLPLGEYLDENDQPDLANIERKKKRT